MTVADQNKPSRKKADFGQVIINKDAVTRYLASSSLNENHLSDVFSRAVSEVESIRHEYDSLKEKIPEDIQSTDDPNTISDGLVGDRLVQLRKLECRLPEPFRLMELAEIQRIRREKDFPDDKTVRRWKLKGKTKRCKSVSLAILAVALGVDYEELRIRRPVVTNGNVKSGSPSISETKAESNPTDSAQLSTSLESERQQLNSVDLSIAAQESPLKTLEPETDSACEAGDADVVQTRQSIEGVKTPVLIGAAIALMFAIYWLLLRESPQDSERNTTPMQVSWNLKHWAKEKDGWSGTPLFQTGKPQVGDGLSIEVNFSSPAYCYLIALNPDGSVDLCWPGEQEGTPRSAPEPLKYPEADNEMFAFEEGTGQQAFLLVYSSVELPSCEEWLEDVGKLEWDSSDFGRWYWRDNELVSAYSSEERGGPKEVPGTSQFYEVCKHIEGMSEDVDVYGVSFPVTDEQ